MLLQHGHREEHLPAKALSLGVFIGVRTEAAKRLLKAAGLLSADVPLLPRRARWRTARRYADSTDVGAPSRVAQTNPHAVQRQ
jgi:hypothetical protein